MTEQLRKVKEVVGSQERSAFEMSKETEQRLIRDFYSPFPDEEKERSSDMALLQNAVWCS